MTAAMNVNIWDVVDDLRAIITAGKVIDPARLADPSVPLGDLGVLAAGDGDAPYFGLGRAMALNSVLDPSR